MILPGEVIDMRKFVFALAVCLLGLALASSQLPAQTQPSAQEEQSQTQAQPSAQRDQSQPQSQAQPSGQKTQSQTQPQGQPSQPSGTSRGVPWVWIALGAAAFVIVVIALLTRGGGTDRSERVERIEHHDDIRRAG